MDTVYKNPFTYMDLGLSVLWAICNVGAEKPEEYGDYFAWGEVEPKEEYTWENYKWCDGTENVMIKYNDVDGKITLDPEDDAATMNWGDNWRMPSRVECQELIDNCIWELTTLNGVDGYKVIGPNNNSIFLPMAAYKYYNKVNSGGSYWPANGKGKWAHTMRFIGDLRAIIDGRKCCGVPIRPVYNEK